MNRSRLYRSLRSRLVEHFELFLTSVGVLLAILLALAELTRGERGVAIVSLVWLQGFMLWAVHRHAWFRRRALIEKLRVMLQDRVNNQLTVMLGATETRGRESDGHGEQGFQTAVLAARAVSHELENLSLESLQEWERRYGKGLLRLLS